MGKRGPVAKPTALRILHGDAPHTINYNEPKPSPGIPEPPENIHPATQAVWDYVVKELAVMGLASRADRDALYAYCEAVRMHADACRASRAGALLRDRDGIVRVNPAVRVQNQCARNMLAFAREFGLTPASRMQFTAEQVAAENTAERLLS